MRIALILIPALAATLVAVGIIAFRPAPGGEADLFRPCATCHVVRAPDGRVLAGKQGRAGPNLYGISGQRAGSVDGFRYREGLTRAGAAGLVWDEEALAAYLVDPTGFLRDYLGDDSIRSAMAYEVRNPETAAEIAAWLARQNAPQ